MVILLIVLIALTLVLIKKSMAKENKLADEQKNNKYKNDSIPIEENLLFFLPELDW